MLEWLHRIFRKPSMVGTPPSARQEPLDAGLHALDFSHRYAQELDYHAAQIMLELGIPPERIGDSDRFHGIRHAAFHPHRREAGGVSPDGQILLDSGVMNLERLSGKAGEIWAKSKLRSRMEAVIAHELAEHETGSNEVALRVAPETQLPIGEGARAILRAMAR